MVTLRDIAGVLFIGILLLVSSFVDNPKKADGMFDGVIDKVKNFVRWVNSQ